jgi:hypothetical protein
MAGSSSLTPKPVSPSRSVKRFTLDEANRTLPLVRRICGDIVKTQQRVADLESAMADLSPKAQGPGKSQVDHALERFQAYVEELQSIGCQLKDPKIGLVDFLGRHPEGRDICLCWKLGEDQIEYWHELNSGYAGRQAVALLAQNA